MGHCGVLISHTLNRRFQPSQELSLESQDCRLSSRQVEERSNQRGTTQDRTDRVKRKEEEGQWLQKNAASPMTTPRRFQPEPPPRRSDVGSVAYTLRDHQGQRIVADMQFVSLDHLGQFLAPGLEPASDTAADVTLTPTLHGGKRDHPPWPRDAKKRLHATEFTSQRVVHWRRSYRPICRDNERGQVLVLNSLPKRSFPVRPFLPQVEHEWSSIRFLVHRVWRGRQDDALLSHHDRNQWHL